MKKLLVLFLVLGLGFGFLFLLTSPADAAKPGANKKIYFIHHSTGEIYLDGGMRSILKGAGYKVKAPWWDGGTDPNDFPGLFNDSASWDLLGSRDIIVFKSCYPSSNITSKAMLNEYKDYYRELYDVYRAHPNVLFVPMSTPPLPKNMTSYKKARRAKKFDKWLKNRYVTDYEGNNIRPFRLHRQLSGTKNHYYLAKKYVADPYDGHPLPNSGIRVGNKLKKRLNNYFNE
ncbi:hypothetical protein KKC88_00600 [Patescibacteria group bacterium]|nr:hypothetical protein [Patescibacteria group bacterium]MBU1673787.1 hypothetical protein [Patescibacteria group bacterium]MBU1964127.1 hypothetical protein [Patescibacteria group bacterium]